GLGGAAHGGIFSQAHGQLIRRAMLIVGIDAMRRATRRASAEIFRSVGARPAPQELRKLRKSGPPDYSCIFCIFRIERGRPNGTWSNRLSRDETRQFRLMVSERRGSPL